jgi:5'-phosphate synthase pdxT subunit
MAISRPHRITIGILALQGAFLEHENVLNSLSHRDSIIVECVRVRTVQDLLVANVSTEQEESSYTYRWLDALILPGGESTTMAILLEKERYSLGEETPVSLLEILQHLIGTHRLPVWGTCAGAILLADHVNCMKQGGQAALGGFHMTVERNAYGSQWDSFQTMLPIRGISQSDQMFPAVFIRAPIIRNISTKDVEVLAEWKNPKVSDHPPSVVAARENTLLVTTFHPELTTDTRMHEYFLRMVCHQMEKNKEEHVKEMAPCLLEKVIKIVTRHDTFEN